MLLTRLPLMCSRRSLIARLACIKRAASVHPEPRSNSPFDLAFTCVKDFFPQLIRVSWVFSLLSRLAASCYYSAVKVPTPPALPTVKPMPSRDLPRSASALATCRPFRTSVLPAVGLPSGILHLTTPRGSCQALTRSSLPPWLVRSSVLPRLRVSTSAVYHSPSRCQALRPSASGSRSSRCLPCC